MKPLLLLALAAAASAQDFRDISYGPHERNKLDVWCAKSDQPAPLLIFIHGGGWAGGDKKTMCR